MIKFTKVMVSPSSSGSRHLATLPRVEGWCRGGLGDGEECVAHIEWLGQTLRSRQRTLVHRLREAIEN